MPEGAYELDFNMATYCSCGSASHHGAPQCSWGFGNDQ